MTGETDAFPLSPMQQGMLFHHVKEPHSGVDIEQLVVHLPEVVDVDRMAAAWQWLVKRHDVLRGRFIWEGVEQPELQVLSDVEVPFRVENARSFAPEVRKERLDSFLEDDRVLGFDLSVAPLLRLTLFRWDEASCTLVWTFHHALLDGRTFPLLLREVFAAYAELQRGSVADRESPPPYRRYAEWLARKDHAEAEEFWRQLLDGFIAPTPLVVDRHPSADDEGIYRQGEAWAILDAECTARLRAMAVESGVTLNSVVMGAWAILLHRYSREDDVVFGATRACRKSSVPDADETVGLFINTVPVRVTMTDEDPVRAVLTRVRRQWLDIRPYEHTPLARVKALSRVPPALPLFETLLVFENYRLDSAMRGLGGSWTDRSVELHELTNLPITLAAYDGDELSFKIEFDRRRLADAAIGRMLGHLRSLLEGIARNPDMTVGELPLMGDTERRQVVEEFNAPSPAGLTASMPGDGGAPLHVLFETQVARRPDALALTCGGESLTYRELNAQANRVARHLVACGITRDSLVGLCMERSNELVIALLAILKSGGAYLPIDLAYPADRVKFMLEDAQAPVLLTQRMLAPSLPATNARVVYVEDVLGTPGQPGQDLNLSEVSGPDDLAYVIYTSGTTGKPKGSMITHRNVVRLFPSTEHWYGFNECDVWTLFHSSAFDFSVWEIWGALLYGGRVVVVPFMVSRSPEAFYELLAAEKVTVLNQTPSAFRQLIQAEESVGQKPLALRYVIFGGEALEMQSLQPWFARHGDETPRLINMYGITETTVHVTHRPLTQSDVHSGSVIGVPIPDLQVYILDSRRRPVPIGLAGEMYVGGAGLARGYLRRPELTEQRFVPDTVTGRPGARLYRTGDLARFLPGRDIEYLGRIDHQVKIRGFRIELGEIESVLCQHPDVREAVVLAREDAPGSKRLVAYAVTSAGGLEITALREHLKQKLPEYMVPTAFVFLEKFPLTNNGKIDVKALPAPEQQRPELARQYIAPRTALEVKLTAIWSKVLRVDHIGVHDNFFELGGDSILSIQIISLARREGLHITPKLLFAHQTIAELAAVTSVAISTTRSDEADTGDLPLTPIQRWFFEQNLAEPHHYNQSFMFEVAPPVERALLERALEALSGHHDALRLRYVRDGSEWRQSCSPISSTSFSLAWVELAHHPEHDWKPAIEEAATSAQRLLNLGAGPLWHAVYFDLGRAHPGRLLIVIHHLAVDGVSWRVLLEDLEAAYRQLEGGSSNVQLPTRTTSFKTWAVLLEDYAKSSSLKSEVPYWTGVTEPRSSDQGRRSLVADELEKNLESSRRDVKVSLTSGETQALLQQVPAAYNTQINDVLLTALARAWRRQTGSATLFTNVEGHGREHLFEDVDLSRTVGWFTSIFPVCLELPSMKDGWVPVEALKAIKEQLRRVPMRGINYGVLRYLHPESILAGRQEPSIVFNYLGQFDQVIADSTIFRFAPERTGPWHSPNQRRRHALEINSMVINGRLEVSWTYSQQLHTDSQIETLAGYFLDALRELISHCLSSQAGGWTVSDFPLASLDQAKLDRLTAGRLDVEDIYPLSPIQTLFYSANPGALLSVFDQWHCTLVGELDLSAFQRAWHDTLHRHPILRSSIHGDGLPEPVQMVHRAVCLPWTVEDWREMPPDDRETRWNAFLAGDRAMPLDVTEAPAMRFALIRLQDARWKFVWTLPAMLLDGWSWPLVYRDASRLYEAFLHGREPRLEPALPYRSYLEWLNEQASEEADEFWRLNLAGFHEPTPLPGGADSDPALGAERYSDCSVQLSVVATQSLLTLTRGLQVTLNTALQGAWAILLNRQSGSEDVVFGAAFAGRPTDLPGAESIVGPLVNNVPVRIGVNRESSIADFVRKLHTRLLELSSYQFTPLMDIQGQSEVPWRDRLFDSVVVFQNYLVDESARLFGGQIDIRDFVGPIHTNYPIMLLVEPGERLRVSLIYDRQRFAHQSVERWVGDLALLLERMPEFLDKTLSDVQQLMSPPSVERIRRRQRLKADSQNYVPPQTDVEKQIAEVWQRMFGIERVGIEENFFDLGGHSLLLVQMHGRLREALKVDFPIVTLFQHPTVRSLARHLGASDVGAEGAADQWRNRARRQKQALADIRTRLRGRG